MKPHEIKLGRVHFVGTKSGAHVHVTTMGEGPVGHRPLCGQIVLNPDEWQSLVQLAADTTAMTALEVKARELEPHAEAFFARAESMQDEIDQLREQVALLRAFVEAPSL